MTRPQRVFLAFLFAGWVGMVLACGGGGGIEGTANHDPTPQMKAEAELKKAELKLEKAEDELMRAEAELKKAEAEVPAKEAEPIPPLPYSPEKLIARVGTPDEDTSDEGSKMPQQTDRWSRWIVYKKEKIRALYFQKTEGNPFKSWLLWDYTDTTSGVELSEAEVLRRLADRDSENKGTLQAKVVAAAEDKVERALAEWERANEVFMLAKSDVTRLEAEGTQARAEFKATPGTNAQKEPLGDISINLKESKGHSPKTVHVSGHYRSNGTYVAPYDRAAPGQGQSRRRH
jgi:hypothetical protein